MQEIEIIENENNIFGYVADINEDSAFEYFGAFFNNDQLVNIKHWMTEKKISEFAVLRNLYIDNTFRGQGLGKELVSKFITKAKHRPIFLLASPDEDSFKLQLWYEKQGFQLTPFNCEDGPLMVKF